MHNFAKFFRNQSHEEREHAEKLMKVQNQRGGRIFLQDVRVRADLHVKQVFFVLLSGPCHEGSIWTKRYGGREGSELLIFTDTQAQPI